MGDPSPVLLWPQSCLRPLTIFLWLTLVEFAALTRLYLDGIVSLVFGGYYLAWTDNCSSLRKSLHNSREADRLPQAGVCGCRRAAWRMLAVEEDVSIYHCQCPACDTAPWLCKMFPPRETRSRARGNLPVSLTVACDPKQKGLVSKCKMGAWKIVLWDFCPFSLLTKALGKGLLHPGMEAPKIRTLILCL